MDKLIQDVLQLIQDEAEKTPSLLVSKEEHAYFFQNPVPITNIEPETPRKVPEVF